jgi:hypothetical protein
MKRSTYQILSVPFKPGKVQLWPAKSEPRFAYYYGRNKAQIFNGAIIDSANRQKFTLNQLHLLAKWKRKI